MWSDCYSEDDILAWLGSGDRAGPNYQETQSGSRQLSGRFFLFFTAEVLIKGWARIKSDETVTILVPTGHHFIRVFKRAEKQAILENEPLFCFSFNVWFRRNGCKEKRKKTILLKVLVLKQIVFYKLQIWLDICKVLYSPAPDAEMHACLTLWFDPGYPGSAAGRGGDPGGRQLRHQSGEAGICKGRGLDTRGICGGQHKYFYFFMIWNVSST